MIRKSQLVRCIALVVGAELAMPALGAGYVVTNLVSDGSVPATFTDPSLKNPWGVSFSPTGPFWVSDNGTGLSTIYNTTGVKQGLVVTVPPPAGSPAGTVSTPTGQVFNNTPDDFLLNASLATFIFVTEDGTISGWNSAAGTTAITKVDHTASGAVYKGVTLGTSIIDSTLYVANFHSGQIESYIESFVPVSLAGNFTDPNLPAGYSPFNIQNIGDKLYVEYALADQARHDDVHGPGNGFVDVYDMNGLFQKRLISGGHLNSPWGIALAPAGFGEFGGDLLVGNFGDSTINAFDPTTGAYLGTLMDSSNQPLLLSNAPGAPGLWDLTFGNGGNGGLADTLYFTSGVNDEAGGLFGSIQVPEPGTIGLLSIAGLMILRRSRR